MVHGGGQHDVAAGEPPALAQQHGALGEIDAALAHIAAERGRLVDDDLVAVAAGDLLDHHGVGAGRHHAAGEDARGFAGADRAVEGMAGGDLADQLQRHRRLGHVGARAPHSRPWPRRRPAAACAAR